MSSLLTLFGVLFGNDTIDTERRFYISKQTVFHRSHVTRLVSATFKLILKRLPSFSVDYMLFPMKKIYIQKKSLLSVSALQPAG